MTLVTGIGIIGFFFAIFIAASIYSFVCDKKRYNGGYCPHCGKKLYQFDVDSQGARGYTCEECCHIVWISYPSVDKRHVNA